MRKLTQRPRIGDASLQLIEEIVNGRFSENFKRFLKESAGLSYYESVFVDAAKTEWHVQQYNSFDDLYGLTQEFLNVYKRKLIPFAHDPGGWHFCLCMDEEDHGAIFINRWTDHLPEEQFLKIANSFEEFIDGLRREEEVK